MKMNDVKIYRLTHIDNIPHIIDNGITSRHSENANPDYINIGDTSLISTRNNKSVQVDNGDIFATNANVILPEIKATG